MGMGRGAGRQEQYQLEGNEQYIYGRALFVGMFKSRMGILI